MAEPGLVPHFERLRAAKYNVVMSAGLILPEGREPDSVLQRATSLASERARERFMSCCADAEINPVTKGKQAMKLGIDSELIPCFGKPQNELKSPRSGASVPILKGEVFAVCRC